MSLVEWSNLKTAEKN
jgi:hypothetical protein